jgi:UDP:flavonoid glycosyltransferase YjiC (YdhE family)
VLAVEDVPHAWLFPRMAAVVHAGGLGTLAAALRAGVPAITLPRSAEQRVWARRWHELGVALPPLDPAALTPERLAAALSVAAGEPGLRAAAAALGARLRAEDGVARAVALIQADLEV